jgi:hypothetical protein
MTACSTVRRHARRARRCCGPFFRMQGLHVVEVQVDSQCLRHSFNNLMLGTERLGVTDAELVDLVGLSQEIAERLPNNSDRGYWDLEMSKVFGSAMFGTRYIVETHYFHEQYGDAEFAEQLQRAGTLGAVLHIRCLDGQRQDHYVPVVPRGNNDGYSIDDSEPSSPSRQLVDAHQIEVTGNLEKGFLPLEAGHKVVRQACRTQVSDLLQGPQRRGAAVNPRFATSNCVQLVTCFQHFGPPTGDKISRSRLHREASFGIASG